jgi:septal ring factor EnvC (AmiA/AmiB activator)
MISAALWLMFMRRAIQALDALADEAHVHGLGEQLLALLLSSLMLAGVSRIAPFFHSTRRSEEALRESEHKLKIANQELEDQIHQLQATDQQLRATNQQLRATEQQLRATNNWKPRSNRRERHRLTRVA